MAGRGKSKARYHMPPNVLREKCGHGGINPDLLAMAQKVIDENDLDFGPFAERFIERLDKAIADARKSSVRGRDVINTITGPIMELKANGAMFEYPLVSDVAGVLLNFLEDVKDLNDDAIDIVAVHRRTLNVIITSRLRGTGGKDGIALLQELADACDRYYKKHGHPGEDK